MSEDFWIEPAAVRSASQTFAEQQPVPAELSASLEGASTVDTGNPAVNAELGGVVQQLTGLLTRYAEVLGQYAQGLQQMVDTYQSTDWEVSDTFEQIRMPGEPAAGQIEAVPTS